MSQISRMGVTTWMAFALIVGFGASASNAQAGGSCHQQHCYYKTFTRWISKTVPYEKQVLMHKPCGTPYYGWKIQYKTVKVPVTYRAKVCY